MDSAGLPTPSLPSLDGHLPPCHPLSPRAAFEEISALTRPLVRYDADALWRRETARLPWALRRLRRQAREFAERELMPHALAIDAAGHDADAATLDAILRKAGAAGLMTDMLPWPLGSMSWSRVHHPFAWAVSIKTEELARACGGLMLYLSAHQLGLAPILLSGDLGALRRFVVPAFRDIRAGRPHVFAFAITEPAAGSDVEDGAGARVYKPTVVARRADGGWRLSGRKCFISGGDIARSIVVFAALEHEGMASWTAFLVRSDMPGYAVARTELKMGMRASGAAELHFQDVYVPDDHVIGGLRKGWALNRATLNLSRIPVASMAVGFAQRAVEIATDFACRYRLGGKPLIHHQEIQLMLADMLAETAAIRALVWNKGRSFTPVQAEASICKFHCTDVAVRVCERAMDLLGNHGMLHHRGVEKLFRDARLTQIFEGTNQINRLAVIEDMQEELIQSMTRSTRP
ncbi:MAG: acyl-CoA dehydrogenase family protein [Gammaproteobacteria bacterium]|nr:acyl-CoA dehydrogenase family protein [Gammaproteobacteria bacterium]